MALWLLHPAITLLVVVGTANHYWLDAVVVVALLAVALAAFRPPRGARTGSAQPSRPGAWGNPAPFPAPAYATAADAHPGPPARPRAGAVR